MFAEQFFPTTIYGKDLKLDNKQLANEIIAWSKQDPGVKKTNMNGWHSPTNMHTFPQFKPLIDELYLMHFSCRVPTITICFFNTLIASRPLNNLISK